MQFWFYFQIDNIYIEDFSVIHMKIEVNITKKYVFIILGILLILTASVVVYAYGTSNPAVFGHSGGEIEWPTGNYCIIQAQNQICPSGFTATTPSGGTASDAGVVRSAPSSVTATDSFYGTAGAVYSIKAWAWCCK